MFSRILLVGDGDDARRLAETLRAEHGELLAAGGDDPRAVALREGADLIVAEAPARRALAEPLPCPVAVAPRGYRHRGGAPRVVGVGFDASGEAIAALEVAERLAARHDARLHVRIVAELLAPARIPPAMLDLEAHEHRARAVLHHALQRLDVPAQGDVVTGSPAVALQTLSQDVDVLLTGAPAHGPHWPLLEGSPAEHLTAHAGCPVIVVPRAGARAQAVMA